MKRLLMLGLAVAALTAPAAAREEPPTAPLQERLRAGASSPPAGDAPIKLGLFSIESADGSHRLELHGRLMATLSYTYSDFDGLAVAAEGHRRADDHAVIARLGLWF